MHNVQLELMNANALVLNVRLENCIEKCTDLTMQWVLKRTSVIQGSVTKRYSTMQR